MIETNTELEPGSLFAGRYEVIRLIGTGAMGAVYLACDPRYRDFLVALKVIYPDLLKSQELRDWFRNEIIVAFGVHHRNIVQAYDYFDEDGVQAYAMEYIEGQDLFDYMDQGALAIGVVLSILKQISLALNEIHLKNILHRDLKPENILVQEDGLIKVADFGVAAISGDDESNGKRSKLVGTPKYLAPEYLMTAQSNAQADIYALGIIAYELLTGELAAPDGISVQDLVSNRVQRPDSISGFKTFGFSDELVAFIDRLLNPNPDLRFATMAEVLHALDRI
jgi:serine/threonine protein kinase